MYSVSAVDGVRGTPHAHSSAPQVEQLSAPPPAPSCIKKLGVKRAQTREAEILRVNPRRLFVRKVSGGEFDPTLDANGYPRN